MISRLLGTVLIILVSLLHVPTVSAQAVLCDVATNPGNGPITATFVVTVSNCNGPVSFITLALVDEITQEVVQVTSPTPMPGDTVNIVVPTANLTPGHGYVVRASGDNILVGDSFFSVTGTITCSNFEATLLDTGNSYDVSFSGQCNLGGFYEVSIICGEQTIINRSVIDGPDFNPLDDYVSFLQSELPTGVTSCHADLMRGGVVVASDTFDVSQGRCTGFTINPNPVFLGQSVSLTGTSCFPPPGTDGVYYVNVTDPSGTVTTLQGNISGGSIGFSYTPSMLGGHFASFYYNNNLIQLSGFEVINATNPPAASTFCNENQDSLDTAIGCIPINDITRTIGFFLVWSLGIAGGIATILIIYAGIMIQTSLNNPKKLQAGRELLTSATAGLILVIFSVFILRVIGVNILQILTI